MSEAGQIVCIASLMGVIYLVASVAMGVYFNRKSRQFWEF